MQNIHQSTKKSGQGRSFWALLCGFFVFFVTGTLLFIGVNHFVFASNQLTQSDTIVHIQEDSIQDAKEALESMQWDDAILFAKNYLHHHPEGRYRWYAWNILVDVTLTLQNTQEAINLLRDMQYEYAGKIAFEQKIALKLAPLYESIYQYSDALGLYYTVEQNYHKQKAQGFPEAIDNHEEYGQKNTTPAKQLSLEQQGIIQKRMARLFILDQNFIAAEEKLHTCISLDGLSTPMKAQCTYDLAYLKSFTHKKTEAEKLLQDLWKMDDIPTLLRADIGFLLADVYENIDKTTKAKEMLQTIRPYYPNVGVVDMRLKLIK